MKRYRILLAGFLLALMGGVSYAWGVFVLPMMEQFGWTKTAATLPFTVFMVVFALMMVPAGRLQDRICPRKVAAAGALLFAVAYGLSALVNVLPEPGWLVFSYGLLGGSACGLTYACVAPPARRWFPDKPGFAIALSVAGFGLAALVVAPIKARYLIPTHGISGTFLIIAAAVSAISFLAAMLTGFPPDGWTPPNWQPGGNRNNRATAIVREAGPREMIATPVFWIIWASFALLASGGLIALSLIPAYGERVVGLNPTTASLAISIFAGFNGFGRPLAGYLSDRFGVVRVMMLTFGLQALVLLTFGLAAVNQPLLYTYSALLGWGYAVVLALFPTLTAHSFGARQLGVNYGLVFTAFGVGAIAPVIGSAVYDATGSYTPAFAAAGVMATLGFTLTVVLKKRFNLT